MCVEFSSMVNTLGKKMQHEFVRPDVARIEAYTAKRSLDAGFLDEMSGYFEQGVGSKQLTSSASRPS